MPKLYSLVREYKAEKAELYKKNSELIALIKNPKIDPSHKDKLQESLYKNYHRIDIIAKQLLVLELAVINGK